MRGAVTPVERPGDTATRCAFFRLSSPSRKAVGRVADLVPADQIERAVGARRHPYQHLGRAVSSEETVYVLHSEKCRDSGIDLRECEWSLALDRGIDLADWQGHEDRAVVLAFRHERLFPVLPGWLNDLILSEEAPDA